jgi:hypothetical protein
LTTTNTPSAIATSASQPRRSSRPAAPVVIAGPRQPRRFRTIPRQYGTSA